jgi:glutamate synthase (NADPH/NADH) large chain
MLRKCHLNTCSVGIATQDPELRQRFTGTPEHVINYFTFVAQGVRRRLAELGARSMDEIIGKVEYLKVKKRTLKKHAKTRELDLLPIVRPPISHKKLPRRFAAAQPWPLEDHIDHAILAKLTLDKGAPTTPLSIELPIDNSKRAAGTLLSGELARRFGARGLPDGSIHVKLAGSAGQSLGAFLAAGVTLELSGDANDYIGKGLSGGRIVVKMPPGARFAAEDNVIIGNVALYGATAGDLFANGLAGERFAVRNSGARAVVEGVGDHGCEYMTGGVVVVLGAVGRNFGAGMSGGTAFVFDPAQTFRSRCNLDMIELEPLVDESDLWLVQGLVEDHVRLTGSARGRKLLDTWDHIAARFVKVMPTEYKRVLEKRKALPRQRPPSLVAIAGGS